MRGEPASSFSCCTGTFPPPGGGSERCLGYPARTRGEVAEWLKAAPSEAPTRRRRAWRTRGLGPCVRFPKMPRLSCADPRRSGRVAEGGALLRRYGGECLHRGFESLLLRPEGAARLPRLRWRPNGGVAERSNAAVSKTVIRR